MARITAYEASDGSLHRDRKAYVLHERNLQAIPRIKAALEAGQPRVESDVIALQLRAITDVLTLNTLREILDAKLDEGADPGPGQGGAEPGAGAISSGNDGADAAGGDI